MVAAEINDPAHALTIKYTGTLLRWQGLIALPLSCHISEVVVLGYGFFSSQQLCTALRFHTKLVIAAICCLAGICLLGIGFLLSYQICTIYYSVISIFRNLQKTHMPHSQSHLFTSPAGICLLGIGFLLSYQICTIYYSRLTFHSLPAKEIILSCFLPVGPMAMTAWWGHKLSAWQF